MRWTKQEQLATLFGIMANGFPHPGDLEPETRLLIGLPGNMPGGGYSIEDTRVCVVETLARILSEGER